MAKYVNSVKSRVLYFIFHILFALILLLLSIVGENLLKIFLYPIGIAIILVGLVSFFPSIIVKTGIFDSYGNEYVATNLFERIGVLAATVLIGGCIMILPDFFDVPTFCGFAAMFLFASAIGMKIGAENRKYSYIENYKKYLGQFVPLVYMAAAAVYLAAEIFGVGPWLRIVAMAVAFAFHACRVIIYDIACDY